MFLARWCVTWSLVIYLGAFAMVATAADTKVEPAKTSSNKSSSDDPKGDESSDDDSSVDAKAEKAKPTNVKSGDSKSTAKTTASDDLAIRAAAVLERCCAECHYGAGSKASFDVRLAKSLTSEGVVEAGKPKDSLLHELMFRGTMPPKDQISLPRPTPEEAKTVADWIAAGAADFPTIKKRVPVTLQGTLEAIKKFEEKMRDGTQRRRYRYFTIAELYNRADVDDPTIDLARAALAKAVNSLSWQREQVAPKPLDAAKTVFAVDITALGWGREHWRVVRANYPYSIGFENLGDRSLKDLDDEIVRLADNNESLYLVRADWFVSTVLQPGLYHKLLFDLSIPDLKNRVDDKSVPANPKHMNATDLERFLQIDVVDDILAGDERAMRSGFTPSRVSGQNRMIERHSTAYGAYWKSYDFKAANRRAILSQFPLGPEFPGNKFPRLAFRQDGGEIVFNLPNGLQGYMLVDGQGNRIDAGPIEVVSDALRTSGTPAIVNGLSCISCHKQGLVAPPKDEIRDYAKFYNDARDRIEQLYSTADKLNEKIDADREQFAVALERVAGKAAAHGEGRLVDSANAEPVGAIARAYLLQDLNLEAVAAELHEPNTDRLKLLIENNDLLRDLGLGILLRKDGKIKRAFWEGRPAGASVMQLTASALDYSTPQYK